MTSNGRNWLVLAGSIGGTLAVSALYFSVAGAGDENIRLVLRLTPRIAFLFLLLVFVARPLRQLVSTPLTAALLRNRRLLGIAFAGIHVAHLVLIVYRHYAIPDFEFRPGDRLDGAFVYAVILLMLATSFDRTARAIGPRNWRILHKAGLYILFAVFTQALMPSGAGNIAGVHGVLMALAIVAVGIRVAAFLRRRQGRPG